ncbi:hypothetical protein KH172YL63_36810 [Bacillus sp. KH172YL63]|nr:hypothetical protein KH172YL63_36810 [Bacillus sp. KH172YL63]
MIKVNEHNVHIPFPKIAGVKTSFGTKISRGERGMKVTETDDFKGKENPDDDSICMVGNRMRPD